MRKVYGASQVNECIFCGEHAYSLNPQRIPVCAAHKNAEVDMDKLKCSCGDYLDVKEGKFGAFFLCFKCGPRSISKMKEINEIKPKGERQKTMNNEYKNDHQDINRPDKIAPKTSNSSKYTIKGTFNATGDNPEEKKNITITTDDVDYFD